ncbi:hypothetical protein KY285_023089 [Solanum tuberosum]|nr:hypothetical protein KY285_023089 [Solanum tuberosum]
MMKAATFFSMSVGAFVFWQTMDKIFVWIALHQDEKQENGEGRRNQKNESRANQRKQRAGVYCLTCQELQT